MRDAFLAAVVGVLVAGGLAASSVAQGVKVTANEAERRVDISIDGKPFTSYLWPASIKKPVLYPLITDHGITVTRGYPLEPRPGERVDHPHHAGLWLNYGDVNGFDGMNTLGARVAPFIPGRPVPGQNSRIAMASPVRSHCSTRTRPTPRTRCARRFKAQS